MSVQTILRVIWILVSGLREWGFLMPNIGALQIATNAFSSVRDVKEGSIAGKIPSSRLIFLSLTKNRDVLQRHQTVHEKEAADGKASARRAKERAIAACGACAAAKLSCDNERPCKVCHYSWPSPTQLTLT